MSITIKTYHSIGEIKENQDKKISETKKILGIYLGKLDETRILAEKSRKIREIVSKLSEKKNGRRENSEDITLDGVKIILDANKVHEMAAIEDVVRSYQEYLMLLQKASESLKLLDQLGDTEGMEILVVEKQGIPEEVLLKTI
jgi:hypothetical protein